MNKVSEKIVMGGRELERWKLENCAKYNWRFAAAGEVCCDRKVNQIVGKPKAFNQLQENHRMIMKVCCEMWTL
jgi:hypothetical protein